MWRVWKSLSLAVVLAALLLHLCLLYVIGTSARIAQLPLWVGILLGVAPFLADMAHGVLHGRFGADFLAALSVTTALFMGQLLVAAIVVLMLSGGQVLEDVATRRASRVLSVLAKRTPTLAHRAREGGLENVSLPEIAIGDRLTVLPHEICPVDGTVVQGESTMDEAFLTGEPFLIRKTAGSAVISGAINGDAAITIMVDKPAVDSRYARIMRVVEEAEQSPPPIRRLGDQLGAFYTPVAVFVAVAAWVLSGNPSRFLSVLVIATPCPLLLAIPTAIMGAVSLAAKRGIIIKKPAVLEQVGRVRTMLFDKTGTLTYGQPELTEFINSSTMPERELLGFAASLEQYSKHPLSSAVLRAAQAHNIPLVQVDAIREKPGEGLTGNVAGHPVAILGRKSLSAELSARLPPFTSGMEAILLVDNVPAGLMRFHDQPRQEGKVFLHHLRPMHQVQRLLIVSGDRDEEVQYLAGLLGVREVRSGLTPEEKLTIVKDETRRSPTLFLGDGVNDAPAMLAATVGVALGKGSDVTAEAAGAVLMDASLERVDELLHIGKRMRQIALESAVGGMCLSLAGMAAAAMGYLPPLWGALAQEAIDVLAVLNSLRAAIASAHLQDFAPVPSG